MIREPTLIFTLKLLRMAPHSYKCFHLFSFFQFNKIISRISFPPLYTLLNITNTFFPVSVPAPAIDLSRRSYISPGWVVLLSWVRIISVVPRCHFSMPPKPQTSIWFPVLSVPGLFDRPFLVLLPYCFLRPVCLPAFNLISDRSTFIYDELLCFP